ncbi:MAG: bifunctional DNA-formamidopyrimidine glycosylase/DNA-(apurinic or apyrimidinic site) lyase [Armatimonadota bacterium]
MPELPELEVLRRQTKAELTGRTITAVTVNQPKAINVSRPEYADRVEGHSIEAVERKGKYLALHLDGDDSLMVHFAMGGSLVLSDSGEHEPRHTPFVFAFEDGQFMHARNWQLGSIKVYDSGFVHQANGPLGQLGPDAWDDIDSGGHLRQVIGGSRAGIKPRLMDQEVISGIGNAYSDEILFRARLHPKTLTSDLADEDFNAVYRAIRDVFQAAIDAGGEGFVDLYGNEGTAQEDFAVHGRGGEKCPGCGGEVEEIAISGRTGYFCPSCQEKR